MPKPSKPPSEEDVSTTTTTHTRPRATTVDLTSPIPHAATYPAVTLYVGQQRQKLLIPATTLTKSSAWFAKAVTNCCTIFHLTTEDSQDMRLLIDFLQEGHYTLPEEDSIPSRDFHGARMDKTYIQLAEKFPECRFGVHRRHVKMYLLGERFDVPTLRDYAFNAIYGLLESEDVAEIWKYEECEVFVEERLRLIMLIYRTPRADAMELKKLFAFKAAEAWSVYMECLEINKGYKRRVELVGLMAAAPDFIHDVLVLLVDSPTTLLGLGKNGFLGAISPQG